MPIDRALPPTRLAFFPLAREKAKRKKPPPPPPFSTPTSMRSARDPAALSCHVAPRSHYVYTGMSQRHRGLLPWALDVSRVVISRLRVNESMNHYTLWRGYVERCSSQFPDFKYERERECVRTRVILAHCFKRRNTCYWFFANGISGNAQLSFLDKKKYYFRESCFQLSENLTKAAWFVFGLTASIKGASGRSR